MLDVWDLLDYELKVAKYSSVVVVVGGGGGCPSHVAPGSSCVIMQSGD